MFVDFAFWFIATFLIIKIIYLHKISAMAGNKKLEPLMKDAKKMKKLMEESFRKVDIDGNGVLDRAEF